MKKLIGTVKAIEMKEKYFFLTVPREVVKKMNMKKGDLFHISIVDEGSEIIYDRAAPVEA
jgi:bifunctional DNA-binding transcriptional regulator/antitoxin component of YhaV-PrlF toxin-antitoxin module